MSLTETQEKMVALLPIGPGILSMISSTILMTLACRESLQSAYRRFLFAVSFFELLNASKIILDPFLVPSSSRRIYSIGNDKTCKFLGALTQLAMPSYAYFSALCIYYVLRIRYSIPDSRISSRFEPVVHLLSIAFAVLTMCVGLSLNLFGEVEFGNGCWISPNPTLGCGNKCAVALQWIFGGFVVLGAFIVVFVSQVLIATHVLATNRRSRSSSLRESSNKQLRFVASQAILFVMMFYLTYIWSFVIRVMATTGRTSQDESILFILLCVKGICYPLMGFGNLLVYVRPRLIQLRAHFPSKTFLWAVKEVLMKGDHELEMLQHRSRLLTSSTEVPNSPGLWRWIRSLRFERISGENLNGIADEEAGFSQGDERRPRRQSELPGRSGTFQMLDIDEMHVLQDSAPNEEEFKSPTSCTTSNQRYMGSECQRDVGDSRTE